MSERGIIRLWFSFFMPWSMSRDDVLENSKIKYIQCNPYIMGNPFHVRIESFCNHSFILITHTHFIYDYIIPLLMRLTHSRLIRPTFKRTSRIHLLQSVSGNGQKETSKAAAPLLNETLLGYPPTRSSLKIISLHRSRIYLSNQSWWLGMFIEVQTIPERLWLPDH